MSRTIIISFLKKTSFPTFFIFLISASGLFAQGYKLNFGLTKPQDPTTLPQSRAAIQKAIKVPKKIAVTALRELHPGMFSILNGWELSAAATVNAKAEQISRADFNTLSWYNATVPGTILRTLVDQGIYPNPYFGLNNLYIPDSLARMDWWYRTEFKVPDGKRSKQTWLLFNGINYSAEIWLNGARVGSIYGAFKRGKFNITDKLLAMGKNTLAIHILPTNNPGIPHEESPSAGQGPNGGQLALDGPTFISSEGWDWVPGIRDRNIGLWQDVCLQFSGLVTITDPQVVADLNLPDTTQAKLMVKATLFNDNSIKQEVTLTGRIGDVNFSKQVTMQPNEHSVVTFLPADFAQLNFKNPRLWWPNGYGKPELYTLVLEVNTNGEVSDSRQVRFGIRELSYEMTVDLPSGLGQRVDLDPLLALKDGKPLFDNVNRREVIPGVWIPQLRKDIDPALLKIIPQSPVAPYLVLKINGRPIFCKGGNWGMDDAMKKTSREFLEPYFKLHKDANFNMIRNWTGESTQESFYELSDEYGMLVWNDFWISTEGYNLYPKDNALFLENAKDVIIRYRNHPSIAIWCARNEGPPQEVIENGLANLVANEDGTRLYQPNSRNLNLRPSGPWHYFKNPADYFSQQAYGFNTELGSPSIPTASSIRKMMAKEDTWPISDTWYYHDLHDGQVEYRKAIDDLYGKPTDLDDFCKKAQLINYDSHRAMFEAWNSKLWNSTSGLLLWMTHPAWPSMVWQVYSWDYETFGSYFGSKKACEPVHIQMNLTDNKVVVVNTSLQAFDQVTANLYLYDLSGKEVYKQQANVPLPQNKLTYCFIPSLPSDLPAIYLARLVLRNSSGVQLSSNDYWKTRDTLQNFKAFNDLDKVKLSCKIIKNRTTDLHSTIISIHNPSKVIAHSIKLNMADPKTGQIVLPAYFSDGYFNLLPGESKEVQVTVPANYSIDRLTVKTEGYNIQ